MEPELTFQFTPTLEILESTNLTSIDPSTRSHQNSDSTKARTRESTEKRNPSSPTKKNPGVERERGNFKEDKVLLSVKAHATPGYAERIQTYLTGQRCGRNFEKREI
ncbi:hypothetical protein TNCV_3834831 [Trichonephila clavipes]|nr:hypothetical protein TNCV_3834831 [Trichonephila clavipes]